METAAETTSKFQKLWETAQEYILSAGVRLVFAILLVVIGFYLVSALTKSLKSEKRMKKMDPSAKSFLVSFISVGLKVVIVITAAAILGVPMTSMIAVLGSAGLAVGLALQGSLSNLAGGLMILIFHPFRVGDYINVGGNEGTVESISILYTRLLTLDNRAIMMPNGTVSNSTVTNYSSEELRRVDLDFSVAYDSDVDQVELVLAKVIAKNELILKDPSPFVRLKEHGTSALVFVTRSWVNNADYWTVYFDLLEQVKAAFDENGIKIPYNQLSVHLDSEK